jgi:uncharacterized membrane protein
LSRLRIWLKNYLLTGLIVVVPEQDLIFLTMSVEEAFKLIVSGGLIAPEPPAPCRPT